MLTSEQGIVLDHVIKGHNLIILGAAGTGKSFVITEIVNQCRKKGLCVALTCSTGIACSVYPDYLKATTVHKWSGINDGRYSSAEIKDVLRFNPTFHDVVKRIDATELLVVDECSMLSKRFIECLNEACRIKDNDKLFGGIQVVLCGDFRQLPPVPNTLYGEDGDFCFESRVFLRAFPHKVVLTQIKRQNDAQLISAIKEVSTGLISEETSKFILSLQRPIQGPHTLTLFSTNDQVDDFNRGKILGFPGTLFEFVSKDSGDQTHLSNILAPRKLWLKIGCPVILLRNLSDRLVNGLRGEVHSINENGPVVHFPSIKLTTPIKRTKFAVFNPRQNRDIAVREQFPLKLAFALTIHKSQGMTLDSVEVDCREIFKPGQLGVAMGRSCTSAGLRVINFSPRACIKQPPKVEEFINCPSQVPLPDNSCCRLISERSEEQSSKTVQDMTSDPDIDLETADTGTKIEDEFDEVMSDINSQEASFEIVLPEDLKIDNLISSLRSDDVLTPWQSNNNAILECLDKTKYLQFCMKEFSCLKTSISELNLKEPSAPVKAQHLGNFYTKVHSHLLSADFRLNCLTLFEHEPFTPEHLNICVDTSVAIRKYLLNQRAEMFSVSNRSVSRRQMTVASRARIRYVGGYCVAKVRQKFLQQKRSQRFSTTSESQDLYDKAVEAVNILNSLREEEKYIQLVTEEAESLLDTSRKQNVNRGLTNISDSLFNFFVKLSAKSVSLLTDENLNKFGKNLFEECKRMIMECPELFETFVKAVTASSSSEEISTQDTIQSVLDSMVLKVDQIHNLYKKMIKQFLMVMLNQFRKDVLESMNVQKKMAHRKQVRVATRTTGKQGLSDLETPSTSTATPHTSAVASSEHAADDETMCKVCCKKDDGVDWVQCNGCKCWLHRNCAGLKHHMKWKRSQKADFIFLCNDCK